MANSIKGNILYNVLLNVSGVLFPLITAPYISRVIEPDGLGLFNFSNTYAYYFACFAALGIPYYGTREIAKVRDSIEKQADFVSEVITISCMSTVLVCAVFFLSLLFVPQINENYLIFLISGVFLYITPFRIDWFFRGREEFRYITSRSLIIKTVSIILLFVFVRQKSDLIIYVILNVFSLTANEIWNYIKLLKLGIRPRIKFSGMKHIKPLVVLFLSTIAWSVYAFLDTIMLGFMTSYDEVGYYSSAVHIARALVPVVTSVAAVTMPRIANYSGSNNWGQISELFDKTFSLVSFVSFPIAFGVVTVAPTFVPLFFGSQFEGTILPLQIVIGVVVAIGFSNLTALQILIGLGYDKLYLYSVLVGTSFNFVINLLLIPYYGASGAAIASVIAEFSVFLVSLYYVYTKTDIRINNFKEMCYSFLCSFTFIPIGIFLYSYTSGWIYVVAFGVVASSLYLLEQWCLKNPSILLLYNVIRSKLSK